MAQGFVYVPHLGRKMAEDGFKMATRWLMMELSWPPDGSKSLQDGFKLSLFWLLDRIFAPRSLTGVFSRPLQNCTKGWLIRTLYVQLCVVTFLASSWAYLGPSWVQLAAILSQLKAIEGHLGAMFH